VSILPADQVFGAVISIVITLVIPAVYIIYRIKTDRKEAA
jgi:hypothetical protein